MLSTFVVGITSCLLFTDISSSSKDGIIKDLTLKKHVGTGIKTFNNNDIIPQLEIPVESHSTSLNVHTDLKNNSEYDHRTRKLYITDDIPTKHYSDPDLAVMSPLFVETSVQSPTTENTHNVSTTEGAQRMMSRVKFQQNIFNSIEGFSYNDDTTNKQTIITRNNYPVIINNIDTISEEPKEVRFENQSEHLPSSTVSLNNHASTGKIDTSHVSTMVTTSASKSTNSPSTTSPSTTSTTASSTTSSSTSAFTSSTASDSTSATTSSSTSATTTSSTSASTSPTTATSTSDSTSATTSLTPSAFTLAMTSYMTPDRTPAHMPDAIYDATTTHTSLEATATTDANHMVTLDDVYRKKDNTYNDVSLPPILYGDSLKLKPYGNYTDVTKYPHIDHPTPVYPRDARITYANVNSVISSNSNRMSSGNDWYNVIDQGYDETPPTTANPSMGSSPMTDSSMTNRADRFDTYYVQQPKNYHEQNINQYKNDMAPYATFDQTEQRDTYGSYNTHFFTENLQTTTAPVPRYKSKWRPGIPFSYQNVQNSGTGLQKINGFGKRMIAAPLQTQERTELISKSERVDFKHYPNNHESYSSNGRLDSFSSTKTSDFSNRKRIPTVPLPKIKPVPEKIREMVTEGAISHKEKYKPELKLETNDKIIDKIAAIRLIRKKLFLSKLNKLKNNPLALRKAISILKAKRDGQ